MRHQLIAITVAFFLSWIAIERTDGFVIGQIYGELEPGISLVAPQQVVNALSQPYYYLAKGRQCFVFVSQDRKHVLKFLNHNRFYFPSFPFSLPQFVLKYAEKRQARLEKTRKSLTFAFERLSDETGIEYLHLQPNGVSTQVELIGPANRREMVDLSAVSFILQKKADTPIFEKLLAIGQEKGEAELRNAVGQVVKLLQKRCRFGLADDDRDIEINFAFLGEQPQLIDPGRLYFDERLFTKEGAFIEMQASTKKLFKWLSQNFPSCAEWLKEEIDSL